MKLGDAAVYPYPAGDTSVRRMALEARVLGFDCLVALDTPPCSFDGIGIFHGVNVCGLPLKDVQRKVKQETGTGTVVSVSAGDNGFNRAVIGIKGVHILRGIHASDKYAFDHICAKMAADNTVAVDIDLSPLIAGRGIVRQRALQRYRDVLVLENRFKFPLTVSSHARSYLDMRSAREITGLCSLAGMDIDTARRALCGIEEIMSAVNTAVRVIP
jgi:ribonuclease P/MRP protein subunit RPP1